MALSHCRRTIAVSPPAKSSFSAPIDLRRVRQLFSSPGRIADSAFLRREVAGRMLERLALVKISPQRVLDAGCGDGADLPVLHRHFPDAVLCGLDASAVMLAQAQNRQTQAAHSLNRMLKKWLPVGRGIVQGAEALLTCGDFARLPLQSGSVDVIWSNLALHWHPQPDRVFEEWRRVLRVDGLLMFSCFGPDTFKELRAAFAGMDDTSHALPFVDMHDFGDMLVHAGFSTPVMDMETLTVTYEAPEKLIADVRAWGGNPLSNRRKGLIGTRAWEQMRNALEKKRRSDGRIGLTYEIVYGHAFRPVSKTTAGGEAIIRFEPRPKK